MRNISARNQLDGEIIELTIDGVSAEVTIRIAGGAEITSVITKRSAERLQLAVGGQATALIKATDVLIATDEESP